MLCRKSAALSIFLATLIALLAFPAPAAGQEKFENEFVRLEWRTGASEEKIGPEGEFYVSAALIATVKKIPERYERLVEIINKVVVRSVISYEVLARDGEREVLLWAGEVTRRLPRLEAGARLEFLDERIPPSGYLRFPQGTEYGRYTLYIRLTGVKVRALLFFSQDLTETVRSFLPQAFSSGIKIAEIEVADVTPPEVVTVFPEPGAEEVPSHTAISVTFSEPMDRSSVERAFSISPEVSGKLGWEGNTLTFTPDNRLSYLITYHVVISTEARDRAGNALPEPYSWTFTTDPEPSPWQVLMIWIAVGVLLLALLRKLSKVRK